MPPDRQYLHECVREICYPNTRVELIIQLCYTNLGVIQVGGHKRREGEFMAQPPDLHTRIETDQCA
jgi:hypothetical protein